MASISGSITFSRPDAPEIQVNGLDENGYAASSLNINSNGALTLDSSTVYYQVRSL